jgi:hypothetical protein
MATVIQRDEQPGASDITAFIANVSYYRKFSFNANAGRYFQLPPYTSMGYRDASGELVNKAGNLNIFGLIT